MSDSRLARVCAAAALLFAAAATGCVTKTIAPSSSSSASSSDSSLAPSLVIERFLRAANANDLDTMAQLFGTTDGPFNRNGSKKEIDDRMFTFATVLRHTDFQVKGEGDPVSGRRDEARNMVIELTRTDGKVTVPFTMVRYRNGWLIEDICLNILTNPRQVTCKPA